MASLAMDQALHMGKRVLIIFGGAHLPRVPVGPEDDLRNSLTCRILKEHPDAVRVISFLDPENLGVDDRIDELVQDKIYVTNDHWTGAINAELAFPEIYSLVTDEKMMLTANMVTTRIDTDTISSVSVKADAPRP